jgi:Holliday junction resolvase
MGKAEREKGKRGEREIARLLRDMGFDAHRTQQYCGNTGDAADVIGIEGFHLEVKRCEVTKIHEWIRQSERDCGEKVPIVLHRRNGEPWYATMPAIDLFQLIKEVRDEKQAD